MIADPQLTMMVALAELALGFIAGIVFTLTMQSIFRHRH